METLLDDYKRKLQTADEFIRNNKNNGSIHDEKRAERLSTKAAEYRSFIVDIERAMARTNNENGALPIPDVSKSVLAEIVSLTQCEIPYYAYGDNEAACEMAQRLNRIGELASTVC